MARRLLGGRFLGGQFLGGRFLGGRGRVFLVIRVFLGFGFGLFRILALFEGCMVLEQFVHDVGVLLFQDVLQEVINLFVRCKLHSNHVLWIRQSVVARHFPIFLWDLGDQRLDQRALVQGSSALFQQSIHRGQQDGGCFLGIARVVSLKHVSNRHQLQRWRRTLDRQLAFGLSLFAPNVLHSFFFF